MHSNYAHLILRLSFLGNRSMRTIGSWTYHFSFLSFSHLLFYLHDFSVTTDSFLLFLYTNAYSCSSAILLSFFSCSFLLLLFVLELPLRGVNSIPTIIILYTTTITIIYSPLLWNILLNESRSSFAPISRIFCFDSFRWLFIIRITRIR